MAAPAALSPLAPKKYPTLPAIAGVRFATSAAGVRYQGRTDVCWRCSTRGPGRRRVHPLEVPSAPVDWCRERSRAARRGRWSSIPATPTPSPASRRRGGDWSAEAAAKASAAAERDFHGLDRRDRRAARRNADRPRRSTDLADAAGRTRCGRRQGDHDHRHLPKVATASAEIDDVDVTINGIAKGAGMIAPDMATMLAFVFTDAAIGRRRCRRCCPRRSIARSTPSPSTATPRPTTRCCCSPPAPRRRARAGSRMPATSGSPTSAGRSTSSCSTSPSRWCATARARASSSRSPSPARQRQGGQAHRPVDRQFAAGQDRVAGEDANWGRIVMAVGKAGEKAERDQLDVWFGEIRVAHDGLRDPGLRRGRQPRLHEEARGRDHRRCRHRPRPRPRCGPAT